MSRNIFHVVPYGTNWRVVHNQRVLSTHFTKEAAIENGRAFALANKPSQLVVHLANGQIQYESTYEDDPYPPRG